MRPGFRQEFKRARMAHKKMEKFEFEVLNFLSLGLGRLSWLTTNLLQFVI
jgi:hypothetical protein